MLDIKSEYFEIRDQLDKLDKQYLLVITVATCYIATITVVIPLAKV